uniref:Putative F-box protein n=1 Tax=Noccaea caerulescens TaxID=107243 RepID=A0A1J3FTB0_NOCCA
MYEWLLNSPSLQEFNIHDDIPLKSGWVGEVWGSSIKRITIFYRCYDEQEDHSLFTLSTPNLVFLDYSSFVAQDYSLEFGDSLVQARLDLRLWKYYVPPSPEMHDPEIDVLWGDATKLIAAIRNVVTLDLSADSLEVFYFSCNSMPEFNNLVNLSFESHNERGWQVLPLLLKKSPNLETLVIKGLVHEITNKCGDACVCVDDKKKKKKKKKKTSCCLLSCQVKVLKIYGYGGSSREVKQMRHFFENLRCLQVVKVEVQVGHQDNYLQVTNELINLLPPACKLHFI